MAAKDCVSVALILSAFVVVVAGSKLMKNLYSELLTCAIIVLGSTLLKFSCVSCSISFILFYLS